MLPYIELANVCSICFFDKLNTDLRKLANEDKVKHSLRQFERILGKLNHLSQLCPPLRTFTSEATFLMGEHIPKLSDAQGNISDEDVVLDFWFLGPNMAFFGHFKSKRTPFKNYVPEVSCRIPFACWDQTYVELHTSWPYICLSTPSIFFSIFSGPFY